MGGGVFKGGGVPTGVDMRTLVLLVLCQTQSTQKGRRLQIDLCSKNECLNTRLIARLLKGALQVGYQEEARQCVSVVNHCLSIKPNCHSL